jgi:hypothetical protein
MQIIVGIDRDDRCNIVALQDELLAGKRSASFGCSRQYIDERL